MSNSKKKANEEKEANKETRAPDFASLSSLEELILRMRFNLGKPDSGDNMEREISKDLRKKLQFLELKAFEQSGRINELLEDIEKKESKE